jgi:hypothetical protein
MRHRLFLAIVLLIGTQHAVRAQGAPWLSSGPRFPLLPEPVLPSRALDRASGQPGSGPTPREPRPAAVTWGIVIGGVAGATVATVLWLDRPCQDLECEIRASLVFIPVAVGGLVGAMVGASIGEGIARSNQLTTPGPSRMPRVGPTVWLRVAVPLTRRF